MRIAGEGGRVCVGYQVAAWLGAWTLERIEMRAAQSYTLTARITDMDTYWSQQSPMCLELVMGQRVWVWSPVSPSCDAESQSLTVTLSGAPSIH